MRVVVVVMLLISLLFFGVEAISESEFRQASYANYDELKASGTFAGGWVPVWFPPSATRIHTGHDLDTSAAPEAY